MFPDRLIGMEVGNSVCSQCPRDRKLSMALSSQVTRVRKNTYFHLPPFSAKWVTFNSYSYFHILLVWRQKYLHFRTLLCAYVAPPYNDSGVTRAWRSNYSPLSRSLSGMTSSIPLKTASGMG